MLSRLLYYIVLKPLSFLPLKQIKETPQYWLWTHKRWKRKMKEDDTLYRA
jgi:lauroyl/myristoyl acyltransferase